MKLFSYLFPRDGDPGRPLVVVSERGCRKVQQVACGAIEVGDFPRALEAYTAMRLWLSYELITGRKSRTQLRVNQLALVEQRLEQVGMAIGTT